MSFEGEKKSIEQNLKDVKYKILVFSGKGGVGKTTLAVNLSYGLSLRGYNVGLLDIDIHGPNVAKMLGRNKQPAVNHSGKMIPLGVNDNLKFLSMGLFLDENNPVIWRGPLKMKVIMQFLQDAQWGSLDFLIIDSPPGTGDEPLTVAQLIPDISGAVIISTPQEVAFLDVLKAISFARKLNIKILGFVKNMGELICPHCGQKIELFKSEKMEELLEKEKIRILGEIPFQPEINRLSDKGISFLTREGDVRQRMFTIIDEIISQLNVEVENV